MEWVRLRVKYYKMSEFTIQGGQWEEIETPIQCLFCIAVVDSQLIITEVRIESIISEVKCRYHKVYLHWFLDTTIPCNVLSSGLQEVGGGTTYDERCVEVPNTMCKQWHTATPPLINA